MQIHFIKKRQPQLIYDHEFADLVKSNFMICRPFSWRRKCSPPGVCFSAAWLLCKRLTFTFSSLRATRATPRTGRTADFLLLCLARTEVAKTNKHGSCHLFEIFKTDQRCDDTCCGKTVVCFWCFVCPYPEFQGAVHVAWLGFRCWETISYFFADCQRSL